MALILLLEVPLLHPNPALSRGQESWLRGSQGTSQLGRGRLGLMGAEWEGCTGRGCTASSCRYKWQKVDVVPPSLHL